MTKKKQETLEEQKQRAQDEEGDFGALMESVLSKAIIGDETNIKLIDDSVIPTVDERPSFTVWIEDGKLPSVSFHKWEKFTPGSLERLYGAIGREYHKIRAQAVFAIKKQDEEKLKQLQKEENHA